MQIRKYKCKENHPYTYTLNKDDKHRNSMYEYVFRLPLQEVIEWAEALSKSTV